MIIDPLRLNPFWTNFWLPSAIYLHLGGQLNVNVCLFISNICRQIISFSRMDNDICHLLYGEIVPREAINSTKLCLEIRPYKPYKNPDLCIWKRFRKGACLIVWILWDFYGSEWEQWRMGWKRSAADATNTISVKILNSAECLTHLRKVLQGKGIYRIYFPWMPGHLRLIFGAFHQWEVSLWYNCISLVTQHLYFFVCPLTLWSLTLSAFVTKILIYPDWMLE